MDDCSLHKRQKSSGGKDRGWGYAPEKKICQTSGEKLEKRGQETMNIEKNIGISEEGELERRIPKSVYPYL